MHSVVSRWDLCTFNNLCTHKYDGLGIDWRFKRAGLLDEDQADHLVTLARSSGVDPGIVNLSGPMRTAPPSPLAGEGLGEGGVYIEDVLPPLFRI